MDSERSSERRFPDDEATVEAIYCLLPSENKTFPFSFIAPFRSHILYKLPLTGRFDIAGFFGLENSYRRIVHSQRFWQTGYAAPN